MKTDKILIITDDSPSSVKAVEYGFSLAKELGARVTLLSVIDVSLTLGNPDAGIFPDDALIALKSRTEDFLARMKKEYSEGIATELLAPLGDVEATIIDTAINWGASLIVAGTHGRTGLNKLFKGSVAESILHYSPVPVCVVPF
jgi:nucleotide-binding universal stress UspA family protein